MRNLSPMTPGENGKCLHVLALARSRPGQTFTNLVPRVSSLSNIGKREDPGDEVERSLRVGENLGNEIEC